MLIVLRIQRDLTELRNRLAKINKLSFEQSEVEKLDLSTTDDKYWRDWPFLAAIILALLGAGALVIFALNHP